MRLLSARIENLYGIGVPQEVVLEDMRVLVGRNDAGKSTLLRALDLLLNSTYPPPDAPHKGYGSTVITVDLLLEPPDEPLRIDDTAETSYAEEHLLNERGLIELRGEFDASKKPARIAWSIRRRAYEGDADYFNDAEAGLMKRCKARKIETERAHSDEFNNVEKRAKLNAACEAEGVAHTFIYDPVPTSGKKRIRDVFARIKEGLPMFRYFRADRPLEVGDKAVQGYFKKKAAEALEGVKEHQDAIEAHLGQSLSDVLGGVSDRINEVVSEDERVEAQPKFGWANLVTTDWRSLGGSEEAVPLEQRGDGFRRITMMAYLRHLADEERTEDQNMIFGFEEPETFLHPRWQEQLFDSLAGMASGGYQIVLTTHSPTLVGRAATSDLVHVSQKGTPKATVLVQEGLDLADIAEDLGVSVSNQLLPGVAVAAAVMIVEGPDDVLALQHAASLYKNAGLITETFDDLGVFLLPAGGVPNVKHWITHKLIAESGRPYLAYVDSDKAAADACCSNLDQLRGWGYVEGDTCLVTRKREMENYILAAAMNRLVPGANMDYGDWDDVKAICKAHTLAQKLGARKVLATHFCSLTLDELQGAFNPSGDDDEFVAVWGLMKGKVTTPPPASA